MPATAPTPADVTAAALEAWSRGWTPLPIMAGQKRPALPQWSTLRYSSDEDVRQVFEEAVEGRGASGVGLLLGEASGGLVDVDLDHPKALRLRDLFLPPTPMMTGRATTRRSHYWYEVTGNLPESTRRYAMPGGEVSVELRSSGGQTVIPPTVHPSGEHYLWEGDEWGGEQGPAQIDGKVLAARVATLAMACVLVDGWPQRGGRHDAYLALAGALLRYGTRDAVMVHPLWEAVLPNFIRALAEATDDEDGPGQRADEVMGSTMERLRAGRAVQGFPTLATLIGDDRVDLVRQYAREIETILGHASRPSAEPLMVDVAGETGDPGIELPHLQPEPEDRNPLDERSSSWEPVDLGPYFNGDVKPVEPGILFRSDGVGLIYPGRVNTLYGRSESGKSWLAFACALSVINDGQRVLYIDCEDEPQQTIDRLRLLGGKDGDLHQRFTYIRPESPLGTLMVNRWGEPTSSESAKRSDVAFMTALDAVRPDLIVLDGLSVLYGLHGLDTNDTSNTERLTGWMKGLTDNGRRTVIIIDHTTKNAPLGATPLGSQHKVAMIQGVALQVHPITRPVPGRVGTVWLAVGKDRLGTVRRHSNTDDPAIAAEVEMDGTTEGRMVLTIKPPTGGDFLVGDSDEAGKRLAQLGGDCDAIALTLKDGQARSGQEIRLALAQPIPETRFRKALAALKSDGRVTTSGAARATRYRLVRGVSR